MEAGLYLGIIFSAPVHGNIILILASLHPINKVKPSLEKSAPPYNLNKLKSLKRISIAVL
jgi:hypothetical protein